MPFESHQRQSATTSTPSFFTSNVNASFVHNRLRSQAWTDRRRAVEAPGDGWIWAARAVQHSRSRRGTASRCEGSALRSRLDSTPTGLDWRSLAMDAAGRGAQQRRWEAGAGRGEARARLAKESDPAAAAAAASSRNCPALPRPPPGCSCACPLARTEPGRSQDRQRGAAQNRVRSICFLQIAAPRRSALKATLCRQCSATYTPL